MSNFFRRAPARLTLAVSALCVAFAVFADEQRTWAPRADDVRTPRDLPSPGSQKMLPPVELKGLQRHCNGAPGWRDCTVFLRSLGMKPVVGVILGEDARSGVRIVGVTPGGPAEKAGLRSGDRLVRIDAHAIDGADPATRIEHARQLLQSLDEKRAVVLTYARDERETTVKVMPKLDRRVVLSTEDGSVKIPDGDIVVRIDDDGKTRIESRTTPLAQTDGLRDSDLHADKLVIVERGSDDKPDVQRREIRIECRGDADRCRKTAVEHLSDGTGPQLVRHIERIECHGDDRHCKKTTDTTRSADPQSTVARKRVVQIECTGSGAPCRVIDSVDDAPTGATTEIASDNLTLALCGSEQECTHDALIADAFRWNGLNLAEMNAQLGRYFGADAGVLVVSAAPSFEGLQAGDVILRADGRTVTTPRELMDVLRGKTAPSSSTIDYLRDRKPGTLQLKTPEVKLPDLSLIDTSTLPVIDDPRIHVVIEDERDSSPHPSH